MTDIVYGTAHTLQGFEEIIALQQRNLEEVLTPKIIEQEGFVTVEHSLSLLEQMNEPYPHVVARYQDKIIGYVLIMLPQLQETIPILIPMFEKIEQSYFEEKAVKDYRYFVMGQVCIDKDFRRQGVFDGLYSQLREQMKSDFDLIVTEVATRNRRSIKAHQRVGFEDLLSYAANGEQWKLIVWKMKSLLVFEG